MVEKPYPCRKGALEMEGSGWFLLWFLLLVFIWIPMIVFAVWLANEKGYQGVWWFLPALFSPLVTFLTVLGLPDRLAQARIIASLRESQRASNVVRLKKEDPIYPCPNCETPLNKDGICTKCLMKRRSVREPTKGSG